MKEYKFLVTFEDKSEQMITIIAASRFNAEWQLCDSPDSYIYGNSNIDKIEFVNSN